MNSKIDGLTVRDREVRRRVQFFKKNGIVYKDLTSQDKNDVHVIRVGNIVRIDGKDKEKVEVIEKIYSTEIPVANIFNVEDRDEHK